MDPMLDDRTRVEKEPGRWFWDSFSSRFLASSSSSSFCFVSLLVLFILRARLGQFCFATCRRRRAKAWTVLFKKTKKNKKTAGTKRKQKNKMRRRGQIIKQTIREAKELALLTGGRPSLLSGAPAFGSSGFRASPPFFLFASGSVAIFSFFVGLVAGFPFHPVKGSFSQGI